MEFKETHGLVDYEDAVSFMEKRVAAIRNDEAQECVWFVVHPPLYTAGTSAKVKDLRNPQFPVFETGRGGEYTYHGPGQRVAYIMLDLKQRQKEPDIKKYVWQLEEWIIQTLSKFSIRGERRAGRIGIWVKGADGEERKIAAIGVRIRHWATYHGISINLDPDLSHFEGIVPCGISDYGVTSIVKELGRDIAMSDLDRALMTTWTDVFETVHSS